MPVVHQGLSDVHDPVGVESGHRQHVWFCLHIRPERFAVQLPETACGVVFVSVEALPVGAVLAAMADVEHPSRNYRLC